MIDDILNKVKEISYGWIDSNKIVHHNAKKNFFLENYKLQTIEETLKYKVGTCWEQVELTRYYAKQNNLDISTLLYPSISYVVFIPIVLFSIVSSFITKLFDTSCCPTSFIFTVYV